MARPWLVMLNSTRISLAPHLFSVIITTEICLSLISIVCMHFVTKAIYNAKVLHRNMRMQFRLIFVNLCIATIARYVLLYYQILDLPLKDNDRLLLIANIARDFSFGYLCGLIAIFGMERAVATFYWEWYEPQSPSTLSTLFLCELVNITFALSNSAGYILEYCTFEANVFMLMFAVVCGYIFFLTTYNYNISLLHTKTKTIFPVSKTFQIRENVEMMKIVLRITTPSGIISVFGFFFFCYYMWAQQEWELSRYLSIALFDLFMALFYLILMAITINADSEFERQLNKIPTIWKLRNLLRMKQPIYKASLLKTAHVSPPNAEATTQSYFMQLAQSLS